VVTVGPDAPVVLAGLEVRLAATVVPPYDGELTWTSDAGELTVDGVAATFRAPAAAGRYLVSASLPDQPDVPGGLAEPFTLVAIPDTQSMVLSGTRSHLRPADGAVDRRRARGAQHRLRDARGRHRREPRHRHPVDASAAGLDLLDGVVPYSVAIGDHEYFPEEDKAGSTEAYRTRFGPERYADHPWYLGSHADGLSHAQRFSAGGRDFLHLAVEWEPFGTADDPSSPLGWAVSMLERYPTLPTIITTHAYLWDMPGQEGRFPDAAREGFVMVGGRKTFPGASGETLFATLVEPFPQVFMVLNGHYHKAALPDKGKFHQVSVNRAGLQRLRDAGQLPDLAARRRRLPARDRVHPGRRRRRPGSIQWRPTRPCSPWEAPGAPTRRPRPLRIRPRLRAALRRSLNLRRTPVRPRAARRRGGRGRASALPLPRPGDVPWAMSEPRTLLCFGDSNTWGFEPATMARYPRAVRWPGVAAEALGSGWQVVEAGLNGRTTVFEDPLGDRLGLRHLRPVLESAAPVDVVAIALGTNDLKTRLGASAYEIAEGAGVLVDLVLASAAGPGGGAPLVLLVAPPPLVDSTAGQRAIRWAYEGFEEALARCPRTFAALRRAVRPRRAGAGGGVPRCRPARDQQPARRHPLVTRGTRRLRPCRRARLGSPPFTA
jgi:lysophospholipase L1-like esterase